MFLGMILDILLRRMAELEISQRDLMDVNPVRKFHERVVTDAVSVTCLG